jgi:hypothetical protein
MTHLHTAQQRPRCTLGYDARWEGGAYIRNRLPLRPLAPTTCSLCLRDSLMPQAIDGPLRSRSTL